MERYIFVNKDELERVVDSLLGDYSLKEVYATIRDGSFRIWIAKNEKITYGDLTTTDFYSSSYRDFQELCDQYDMGKSEFICTFFPEWGTGTLLDPDYFVDWEGFLLELD